MKNLAFPLFAFASSSLARPATRVQNAVDTYSQIFTSIGSVPDLVPYFYGTPLRATYPTLDAPLQPGQALSIAGTLLLASVMVIEADERNRSVHEADSLGLAGSKPEHRHPLRRNHARPGCAWRTRSLVLTSTPLGSARHVHSAKRPVCERYPSSVRASVPRSARCSSPVGILNEIASSRSLTSPQLHHIPLRAT